METDAGCKNTCATEKLNPYSNPKITLGEHYDIQIQAARERVEELCVAKAKLEAMQLLNHPYHQMTKLVNGAYSF